MSNTAPSSSLLQTTHAQLGATGYCADYYELFGHMCKGVDEIGRTNSLIATPLGFSWSRYAVRTYVSWTGGIVQDAKNIADVAGSIHSPENTYPTCQTSVLSWVSCYKSGSGWSLSMGPRGAASSLVIIGYTKKPTENEKITIASALLEKQPPEKIVTEKHNFILLGQLRTLERPQWLYRAPMDSVEAS